MRLGRSSFLAAAVSVGLALSAQTASAECNCAVAVAADVAASVQAEVMKADGLYARGDFDGALALYAKAYASTKDAALLYAQGMIHVQLGARDRAKAMFQQYLAASGSLAFRDRVEAQLGILGGATAAVSTGAGKVGGLVGDVGGTVRGTADTTVDTGVGVAGAGVGAVGGVAAGAKGKVKVGRKAGIVLGVIAVAALGAVLVHSISAGVSDDIELDPKFDLGLGLAGVSVGISAIYVAGLTATTAAVGGAPCVGEPASRNAKPVGLAAGFRF